LHGFDFAANTILYTLHYSENETGRLTEQTIDKRLFAGFSCIADDDGASSVRAITNMLQHLQHIASTWSRVLPTNAYYKSLGQFSSLSAALLLT